MQLATVGLQTPPEVVGTAQRREVAAVDRVDVKAEPRLREPADEVDRKEAVVAAGEHPRRDVRSGDQRPSLGQRRG